MHIRFRMSMPKRCGKVQTDPLPILTPDLPLLASAAASVNKIEQEGSHLVVDSPRGVGVPWQGSALVNGRLWPVRGKDTLWLPSGAVVVESTPREPALQILDFNGELRSASASASSVSFSYQSSARAMAVLSTLPAKLEIDGAPVERDLPSSGSGFLLILPRGQHLVQLEVAPARREKEKAP
jgi:hypothetical protein